MGTDEIRSNKNVVYRCTYQVVWCTKYRRDVLEDGADARLRHIALEVCTERDAPIHAMEIRPDQVRLFVSCDPQFGIHRLVKQIKARTSRALRQEFPQVKSRIPTLWTNSYFVATVGDAAQGSVEQYVADQRHA
ncbi:IS200/IS605 family transposase [Nocardia sp. NPDC004415]